MLTEYYYEFKIVVKGTIRKFFRIKTNYTQEWKPNDEDGFIVAANNEKEAREKINARFNEHSDPGRNFIKIDSIEYICTKLENRGFYKDQSFKRAYRFLSTEEFIELCDQMNLSVAGVISRLK